MDEASKERETLLLKATLHVKQAMIQRKLANTKIQESIDDKNLPHHDHWYTLIASYLQNMELPYFGELCQLVFIMRELVKRVEIMLQVC